jgi:hypothetical protein
LATNFVDFQQALIEGYIILTDMGQQEMEALHNKPIQQKKGDLHKTVKNFLIMEYITFSARRRSLSKSFAPV